MNAVTRFIDTLQDNGGLKGTDIANFTDVSSATVHRWKAGSHAPKPDVQLLLAPSLCREPSRRILCAECGFGSIRSIRNWRNDVRST